MSAKTYDRQSGKLLARIAENLPEMSADVMQGWIDNPLALQKVLYSTLCPPLLKFVQNIAIPTFSRFVATEAWGQLGLNKDGVKIAFLGENFKIQFSGLIENSMEESGELTVSCLKKSATVFDIVSAIPEGKRAISAGQIYHLVRAQETSGGKGPLLTNGWANLFLSYGLDGNIWLVGAGRYGGGWRFSAGPLGDPGGWSGGRRVFFRK